MMKITMVKTTEAMTASFPKAFPWILMTVSVEGWLQARISSFRGEHLTISVMEVKVDTIWVRVRDRPSPTSLMVMCPASSPMNGRDSVNVIQEACVKNIWSITSYSLVKAWRKITLSKNYRPRCKLLRNLQSCQRIVLNTPFLPYACLHCHCAMLAHKNQERYAPS